MERFLVVHTGARWLQHQHKQQITYLTSKGTTANMSFYFGNTEARWYRCVPSQAPRSFPTSPLPLQNHAVAPAFCLCTRRPYSHGSSRVGQSVLRGVSFFEHAEALCYKSNITNTHHSLQEKSRQLSGFFVSVTQEHGGYGCVP